MNNQNLSSSSLLNNIIEKHKLLQLNEMVCTKYAHAIKEIYFSKINARNKLTKTVEFNLKDLKELFNVKKINKASIRQVIHELSNYTYCINGIDKIKLFKKCEFCEESWNIILECSEAIEKYIFDLPKGEYNTYHLSDSLFINSGAEIRLFYHLLDKEYMKTKFNKTYQLTANQFYDVLGWSMEKRKRSVKDRIKCIEEYIDNINNFTELSVDCKLNIKYKKLIGIIFEYKKIHQQEIPDEFKVLLNQLDIVNSYKNKVYYECINNMVSSSKLKEYIDYIIQMKNKSTITNDYRYLISLIHTKADCKNRQYNANQWCDFKQSTSDEAIDSMEKLLLREINNCNI